MTVLLVVEDDSDLRAAIVDLLVDDHYEVLFAKEGAEALRLLLSIGDIPAVVLLDMCMPGVNGWEFLRMKHENECVCSVPVVILTAARVELVRVQEMNDVALIVQKPFTEEKLLHVLTILRATSRPPPMRHH